MNKEKKISLIVIIIYFVISITIVLNKFNVISNLGKIIASINYESNLYKLVRDSNPDNVLEENGVNVYYYKGNVTNNNVLFGNLCWQMVRTTDKGGVKLIYQGKAVNGACPSRRGTIPVDVYRDGSYYDENAGTYFTSLANTYYNNNLQSQSLSDVGYMYDKIYYLSNYTDYKNGRYQNSTYVYGKDVSYSNGVYTLQDIKELSFDYRNENNYEQIDSEGYRYSCLCNSNTCNEVKYIVSAASPTTVKYYNLSNGRLKTDIVNDSVGINDEESINKNDSYVKKNIDKWYKENLTNYTQYLEDAVYCNDRSLSSNSLPSERYALTNNWLDFRAWGEIYTGRWADYFTPTLTCAKRNDRFTVDSENGNGKLTYPVGLLTADEVMYSLKFNPECTYTGMTNKEESSQCYSSYLSQYNTYFTMTPRTELIGTSGSLQTRIYSVSGSGIGDDNYTYVVPSITLNSCNSYSQGTGTLDNPYVITSGSCINVTFNDDDRITNTVVEPNSTVKEIKNKGKDGYSFSHWSTQIDGEAFDFNTRLLNDITLYAVYEKRCTTGDDVSAVSYLENESLTDNTLVFDQTDNHNLRYISNNPNNYVNFNGELWRIIGTFETEDENGNIDKRLKLIRDESIGNYPWDTSTYNAYDPVANSTLVNGGTGVNEWSTSKLKDRLNSDSTFPLTEDAKQYIDTVKWNTGALITNPSSNTTSVYKMYEEERGNNTGKYRVNESRENFGVDRVERTTSWIGKVGLVYPSDVIFASDEHTASSTTREACLNDLSKASTCVANNNWLTMFQPMWTITPSSGYWSDNQSTDAVNPSNVMMNAVSTFNVSASSSFAVKPSVYLSPKTIIESGEGTIDKPYNLKLAKDDACTKYVNVTYIDEDDTTTKTIILGNKAENIDSKGKEGYSFKYWSEDKETEYDFDKGVFEDLTLYAVYEKNVYTVTFIDNNEIYDQIQVVNEGEKAHKVEDPSIEGYTFKYWVDESSTEYDFDSPVTRNIILTSHYDINKYNVEFYNIDLQGEYSLVKTLNKDYNSNIKEDEIPKVTLDDKEFQYWSEDKVLEFDFNTKINKNYKLYAVYKTDKNCELSLSSNKYIINENNLTISNVGSNETDDEIKSNLITKSDIVINNDEVIIRCDDKTKTYKIKRVWIPQTGQFIIKYGKTIGIVSIIIVLLIVINKQRLINKR